MQQWGAEKAQRVWNVYGTVQSSTVKQPVVSCSTFKLLRPSKANTKIANGAMVLHQSKWAVYNRRMSVWWSELKKWIGGAPVKKLRARLCNHRVQRMKVVQGGAVGWSESRMTVWAMTVSIVRVRLSRVLKRMMIGVGVMMEERLKERVNKQWAREQQFDWEYCC